jgi:hypothetical protein
MPWDLSPHLPWHVVKSPADQWAVMPSFLIGEWMFIALAVIALLHARAGGRKYVMVWIGALVAGTANDLIFMALPLVDNFWQAQGTIMLTPRLPLYIPCVYVCFMYYPTVAVWRLGLRPISAAALTGIVAAMFYAPYDIVGAKFLWWTWHDTDRPIENRLLGAPIGSTMWVVTYVASFAFMLGRVVVKDPQVSPRSMAIGIAMVAGLSSFVMVLQVTVLQQIDGGVPGPIGLVIVVAIYLGIVARGWSSRGKPAVNPRDALLHRAACGYFATLVVILAIFDPATHVSTSMHQTYGECHVEAKDIAGFTRYEFVCAEDFDEDYSFACVDALPAEGAEWYTVCGRAHTSFAKWMAGVLALGIAGIAVFTWLLSGRSRRSASAPPR